MTKANIILIIADDMGYGDFGVFNNQISCTPHLDALVDEGITLTQHYSAAPVCAPARAALMTGRYPHRTGSIDTLEARGLDRLRLDEITLADVLRGAGYATGLVGKWHNGALDSRYHPRARGFDEFVGFQGGWNPYYRYRLDRNGAIEYGNREQYLTDVFSDAAIDFVERHSSEPFFLQLAYNAPHFPLEAPDAITRKYNELGLAIGTSLIYAMIEVMDAGIGRINERLGQLGIADNTIVIFTSDNGPALGEWNGMSQRRWNCDFNGGKGNTYEGGIRVPLIMRWLDGLEGGARIDDMAHFTDWLPTLLNLAGIDKPDDLALDGIDISPVLRGEGEGVYPQRFWQWNRYTPVGSCNAAMRDGDWKLLRPQIREAMQVSSLDTALDHAIKYMPEHFDDMLRDPEPTRQIPEPPPALLFNLADDPLELQDLAAQNPQRVSAMESALADWFADVTAL
ncbi:MAG: sulfatase-like hydrolase/transferase [Chloroflexi bacterium]|nr:sulfatase-like hydrolase/transferase [Chloroflexota bacterium]